MASSNAPQPPADEGRGDFRDGWCCPKHPDVLLRVRKQGEWKIVKESCRKCDAVFDLDLEARRLELEARRRDLGLAVGPNVVPHAVAVAAAVPEVPPPAVAVAAMPDPPEEVPVAVAVPAVPHQSSVKQVTAKSLTDAKGRRGTYTGSILRVTGKPHGSGKMEYDNGVEYEGGWIDGCSHGDGVYAWGPGRYQGDKYDGEFKHGKAHGRGVCTYSASGSKYEGEWKNSKKHGRGVFTWKNGDKYEGKWKDHKRDDRGVFTYADGRTEERTYENGARVA